MFYNTFIIFLKKNNYARINQLIHQILLYFTSFLISLQIDFIKPLIILNQSFIIPPKRREK